MVSLIGRRLLWSRLLTRTGDQAWDFALPLTLVTIIPAGMQAAAFYYLMLRTGHVFLAPKIGSLVDTWPRSRSVRVGIGSQVLFMLAGLGLILAMHQISTHGFFQSLPLALFGLLILAGLGSHLGALMTELVVTSDIIPSAIPSADLSTVNAKLARIDLATEVGAPFLAGLLLSASPIDNPFLGFTLIALWNVLSFGPEYILISGVLNLCPELKTKKADLFVDTRLSFIRSLWDGWRDFFRQPTMPAMLAYALLWLSVLSPHGVLLTAFLKQGWHMPEAVLGFFRAGGALFGLLGTYAFPRIERFWGVRTTARAFIIWQAVMVLLAIVFFRTSDLERLACLLFILLSRIGLYGFTIGETHIRQTSISAKYRGRVHGFASALTSVATLGIYGIGSVYGAVDQFGILVYGSGIAVCTAALLFTMWSLQTSKA